MSYCGLEEAEVRLFSLFTSLVPKNPESAFPEQDLTPGVRRGDGGANKGNGENARTVHARALQCGMCAICWSER